MELKLFLDCDGVLANFNKKFHSVFGMEPEDFRKKFGPKVFWLKIKAYDNFFASLDLMPDAMELFNAVEHLKPTILTGCPWGNWAQPQKLAWRDKYFPHTEMICTNSRDKRNSMVDGKLNILIDDLEKFKHLWEEQNGVFILHKNAKDSILELKSHVKL